MKGAGKMKRGRAGGESSAPVTTGSARGEGSSMLWRPLYALGWLGLLLLAAGCQREDGASAAAETAKTVVVKPSDPNLVQMEHPERFPLAEAKQKEVADEIRVNGVVAPDVSRSVPVLSLSGGRVLDVRAKLGDEVRKGQLLLRIRSPELSTAFADYQKSKADELLARRQLERSQELFAHGAIAAKDMEAAQNAEDKAKVDVKTAANHVRVLGGDPERYATDIELRAPISGTIVEQNVAGGTGVRSLDATANLFTIADLSRVWVLCDLYEDVIHQVRTGDTALVRLNAYPDLGLRGKVSNIGQVLDPATRSAKVRIELANPNGIMRTGMFVNASLSSPKKALRLYVPASAVVRLHDRCWVFLALGGNRFCKTEVQTGSMAEGDLQQVLAGLRPGDKVVANALHFVSASEVKAQ